MGASSEAIDIPRARIFGVAQPCCSCEEMVKVGLRVAVGGGLMLMMDGGAMDKAEEAMLLASDSEDR